VGDTGPGYILPVAGEETAGMWQLVDCISLVNHSED
jgi:hypothetical protein